MNNDFINTLQSLLLDDSNNNLKFLYDNMSPYQKEIFNNMKNKNHNKNGNKIFLCLLKVFSA